MNEIIKTSPFEIESPHHENIERDKRLFFPSRYCIVSLDAWTTKKLAPFSQYAPLIEIRTFYNWNTTTDGMVKNNIKDILVPTMVGVFDDNPYTSYLFCYSVKKGEYVDGKLKATGERGVRIPIELSTQFKYIPNKMILYVRDSTKTLEKLLMVNQNE